MRGSSCSSSKHLTASSMICRIFSVISCSFLSAAICFASTDLLPLSRRLTVPLGKDLIVLAIAFLPCFLLRAHAFIR